MIVVVGSPIARDSEDRISAGGPASLVALAAAAAGRQVQIVGRMGDDATADAVILDLSRGGVGHVALLRDPAHATPLEAPPVDAEEVGPGGTSEPGEAGATTGSGRVPAASARVLAASRPLALEPADVDLGLRYLTDFEVVVVTEALGPDVVAAVAEATRWAEARLVLVVPPAATLPDGLAPDVVVFEAPEADPDGAFANLVGTFAAALDDGADAGAAFRASIAADGWTESETA